MIDQLMKSLAESKDATAVYMSVSFYDEFLRGSDSEVQREFITGRTICGVNAYVVADKRHSPYQVVCYTHLSH